MKSSIKLFFVLAISTILLFAGCQLDPQSAKEKMAYNNFMGEVKATNFMDGKIGNVKYEGNSVSFDVTDSAMNKDDMTKIIYNLVADYANANNKAQTGITVLKMAVNKNGQQVCKVVYQAGPSMGDDISSNVKLTWFGEYAEAGSGTTTPPATGTTPPATSGGTSTPAGSGQ
jgi:hypothetical protein